MENQSHLRLVSTNESPVPLPPDIGAAVRTILSDFDHQNFFCTLSAISMGLKSAVRSKLKRNLRIIVRPGDVLIESGLRPKDLYYCESDVTSAGHPPTSNLAGILEVSSGQRVWSYYFRKGGDRWICYGPLVHFTTSNLRSSLAGLLSQLLESVERHLSKRPRQDE